MSTGQEREPGGSGEFLRRATLGEIRRFRRVAIGVNLRTLAEFDQNRFAIAMPVRPYAQPAIAKLSVSEMIQVVMIGASTRPSRPPSDTMLLAMPRQPTLAQREIKLLAIGYAAGLG